jgi:hypothetical protein
LSLGDRSLGTAHTRVAFWPALVDNPSFHNPTEF